MKKALLVLAIVLAAITGAEAQITFQQSFAAGGVPGDYVGNGTNEFDGITTSGTGVAWSIVSNALQGVRTATNTGAASRTTDLALSNGAIYQFSINVLDVTLGATTGSAFYAGSAFTTANSAPANADTHSRFGINLIDAATDGFQVRDIGGGTNSLTFTGLQSLFFVVNNSGGSLSYTAPDATTQSVANDTWDLWVGTTQAFNDIAATTSTQSITDFKLVLSGGAGTVQYDNFTATAIPEPATLGSILFGAGLLAIRRRRD